MKPVLISLLFLLLPALILYLSVRYEKLRRISPIILCYVAGLILGNTGLMSGAQGLQSTFSDVTIALSLPLLLFSLDVRQWSRLAAKSMLSMVLAAFSIVVISLLLMMFFRHGIPDAWQLSGMAIGLYTGGTPNLAAIKTALQVDSTRYLMFHSYDLLAGVVYLLFVLSVAQKLFNRFLIPFRDSGQTSLREISLNAETGDEIQPYVDMVGERAWLPLLKGLIASIAVVGLSLGVGQLIPVENKTALSILLISTFAILLSFNGRIRQIPHSFPAGMYLIYVFSLVVASMADFRQFTHPDPKIFAFVFLAVFISFILHALLCKLFRIDTDTFLVTSVSAICSPPFVPAVTAALDNRALILSGLTTGIIGYAAGNYLGISLAFLYKLF